MPHLASKFHSQAPPSGMQVGQDLGLHRMQTFAH